ncbi:hypothetical protein FSP39_016877 [Pinctada imbricata]|uniref:Uncharacterized protein n=1 Tax=Pinctada imbricata TaxID=66713 RepID=A0AA88XUI3_PINIB|nr:hypothetical protein FSP39_016877 [Pinctada imbricata]
MDAAKFKPAPDRPRIFMSKAGKVVIVFPNGEIVEGDVSKFISRNGHMRSREAPSGIKIEVSIDEALRRKDNGRKKDVITHGIMTVMH